MNSNKAHPIDMMNIGETMNFKIGPCMKPITRLMKDRYLITVKGKNSHEETTVNRATLIEVLAHNISLITLKWEEKIIESN